MKKLIFILVLLLSAISFASEDSIVGLWITEKGASGNQLIVEIYKNKDKYNGRIKNMTIPTYPDGEFKGQEKMDLNNKDKSLKNRKLIGIDFVYNFDYNATDDKYENGNIYNPENGKVYHSYMKLNKDNTLTVKGSIDKSGLIGKKQIWKRYN